MVEVFFYKKVGCPFDQKQVGRISRLTASLEKRVRGIIEVTVVSEEKIRELNRKYRKKNKTTDVLSFSLNAEGGINGPFFGELYLCYSQIKKQSAVYGVPVKEEFARMLVHGLLHLAGHDHRYKKEAETMFNIQERVIKSARSKKII